MIVKLITDRKERVAPKSILQTERGALTVTSSQAYQDKFIVHFAEIKDRNEAERWRNVVLRAEPIEDPAVMWIHDLIGKQVFDQDGTDRGNVLSVVANPASDLLELSSGVLIPLTFVIEIADTIRIEVPAGLFDL